MLKTVSAVEKNKAGRRGGIATGLKRVAVRALSERATSEQRPQRNENASCGVVGGTGRPEVGKAKEEPGGPADRERVTERGGGKGGNLYFAVVGSMVFPPKKRYAHILFPRTCDCDLIWKRELCL